MRWNLKNGVALATLAVALAGCGVVGGRKDGPGYGKAPEGDAGLQTADAGPMAPMVAPEAYNPSDNVQYDEVGYANVANEGSQGNQTASGEPYFDAAISVAHATLPMPSYVELTRLDNGKTIIARVNDRAQPGRGASVSLSRGAAQLLNMDGANQVPVRIRKVNPTEQEKAALRAGQKGGERLDTPAPLLVALRKKLGMAPVAVAVAPRPTARPVAVRPAPVAMPRTPQPQSGRVGPAGRAGADYGSFPQGTDAPGAESSQGDPFIIEDGSSRPARAASAIAAQAASGRYYVQLAAFSVQARAASLARDVGGQIERSGSVYRVKMGPYGDEGSARAALGQAAAKGYRDARITR
jgi:rare lipoprotein A